MGFFVHTNQGRQSILWNRLQITLHPFLAKYWEDSRLRLIEGCPCSDSPLSARGCQSERGKCCSSRPRRTSARLRPTLCHSALVQSWIRPGLRFSAIKKKHPGSFFTWLHSRLSRYSTHRDQIQRWRSFTCHPLRKKSTPQWSKVTTMIWIIHLRSTQNWILSQRPRYRHWLDRYADDWNRRQTWTGSRLRS